MRLSTHNPVHRLRAVLAAGDLDALADADLLRRFAAARDEGAFAALVRRHTSLVLGTARRVLANPADADDVFQAVFLTLSRKAAVLRCERTLAPWLYRVTFRLAIRVRKRTRPATPAGPAAADPASDPLSQITGRELCSVIDEELARLSAGLRAPVVLCCLQGLTRDEAAAKLGWSVATLKRRLGRARELLEVRLRARGISLPAALLLPAVSAGLPTAAGAAVSAATVAAAVGHVAPPERVAALCGPAWAAKTGLVLVASCGVLAAGLLLGFPPRTPVPPRPDAAPVAPDRPDTPVAGTDAHGDPLPAGAVARIGTVRFRHDDWLNHAAWSPDGKLIASAAGRVVIVWDAETGRELARQSFDDKQFPLDGADRRVAGLSYVAAVEWSPDGGRLATAFNNRAQLWAWDGTANRLTLKDTVSESSGVDSGGVKWGDPLRLITASGSRVTITDLPKGTVLGTIALPGDGFERVATQPAGTALAVATGGERGRLLVYDWLAPAAPPRELAGRTLQVAFSSDGKTFAAATEAGDKTLSIELWDTTTWKARQRIPYPSAADRPSEIRALALSPDGKTLVTGAGDKTLRWWDVATGKEVRKTGPGWVYYNRAAFRPDGKVLMTASHENHVRLWDAATGAEQSIPRGPGWVVVATAFTPDGRRVVSVSERTVYVHDAATGKELWRGVEHTDSAVQVVVTPDGRTAVSSGHDGLLAFWDVETGKAVRKVENPRHSVDHLTLSPDGSTLVALGGQAPHDGVVRQWDMKTGRALPPAELPAKDARHAAYAIRHSPDGSGIAVASGTELGVPVFDPVRNQLRQTFGKTDGGVSWADYSGDGRTLAAATLGGSLYLWETATGQERLVLKNVGYATCLAFSPDGRLLAVANNGTHRLVSGGKTVEQTHDRTVVRVLDAFTGKEVHRFAGHTGSVYRLSWAADGRRLMSASYDATCLVWDASIARAKLTTADLPADEATRAVESLADASSGDAYAAMAKLAASPAAAVPALRTVLRPVPAPDADRVASLIGSLDAPQFAARDRAAADLRKLGAGVEGPLRKALAGSLSAEARDRIEKVLGELKPSADRLRQGRALEVLERVGDGDARKLLAELAAGADGAWLTREAKAALTRTAAIGR